MIDIDIYECKNRFSATCSPRRESWSAFAVRLNNPDRVPLTITDYEKLPKERKSEIKDRGGYVGGVLRDGIRGKGHVESRCLVCLDADYASKDFIEKVRETLPNTIWVVHSSFSHTPEKPRYRLVIPLKEVSTEEEYSTIAYNIALKIGIENFDKTSFQAERIMFFPLALKTPNIFTFTTKSKIF